MGSTQTTAFEIDATQYTITAHMYVDTPEQAREIAAAFPKSAKVRGGQISGHREGEWAEWGFVQFNARVAADGVNGGRNETGIKRYHTFRRTAEKLGYGVAYVPRYSNSLTEAELDAATA